MSSLRILVFFTLVVGACGPASRSVTLTSGELSPTSTGGRVALALAMARCDRGGATCPAYASREACIDAERRIQAAELDLHYCARGFDDHDIEDCATAIRRTPCSTRVRDLAQCRQESLCPPWPNEGQP